MNGSIKTIVCNISSLYDIVTHVVMLSVRFDTAGNSIFRARPVVGLTIRQHQFGDTYMINRSTAMLSLQFESA